MTRSIDNGVDGDAGDAGTARAEASLWIVRLHGRPRTPQLEASFREWLNTRPQNAREFERLTDLWDIAGAVKAEGLPRPQPWQRQIGWPRWAAAALVIVLALWLGVQSWLEPIYTTSRGEQRIVRLDDGTRITLNSNTRLRVEYAHSERRVRLRKGEAYFEVSKDARRPFIVEAGDRQVVALGTTFVVRHETSRTDVTLLEGRVAVQIAGKPPATITAAPAMSPSSGRASDAIVLSPGERLRMAPSAAPTLDQPRMAAVTAWRRGEVLLDATPLAEAVAEMNRYDERQLIIEEPALLSARVSGVFKTGDSGAFARAVADLHGFTVMEEGERIYLRSQSD